MSLDCYLEQYVCIHCDDVNCEVQCMVVEKRSDSFFISC
jgi:hypothetical protein